jgi:hypothetical protein
VEKFLSLIFVSSHDCEWKRQHLQRGLPRGASHKAGSSLGLSVCLSVFSPSSQKTFQKKTDYPTYYKDNVKEYEVRRNLLYLPGLMIFSGLEIQRDHLHRLRRGANAVLAVLRKVGRDGGSHG